MMSYDMHKRYAFIRRQLRAMALPRVAAISALLLRRYVMLVDIRLRDAAMPLDARDCCCYAAFLLRC